MGRIGRRLALAFLCVIVFMGAQGVIAYLTTISLDELQQKVTKEELFISRQQLELSEIRLEVYKLLGTMNPQEMDESRQYFDEHITLLSSHLIELGLPKTLVELNRELYRGVIELQYKFMVKTARQLLNGQSKTVHDSLLAKLETLARTKSAENNALLAQAQREALITNGALLLAALLVASLWAAVLARNLTDRKRAERALKASEEKYRLIFESAEIMISVFDANGTCLMMNRNIAKWLNGTPEQFIGKTFADLHPPTAEEYTARVAEVIRTGERRFYEDEVAFPQGNRWLVTSVYPLKDSQGRIYAAQLMSHDLTARKKAESDKKRLEAQLPACPEDGAWAPWAGGIATISTHPGGHHRLCGAGLG
jgi:PAS domain S-box